MFSGSLFTVYTPCLQKNFTRKQGKKYHLSVSLETVKCFSGKT